MRFYGPAQFTDADVLACMEEATDEDNIKQEVKSPRSENDEQMDKKSDDLGKSSEKDEIYVLREKLKKLEDTNKCSKCLVSFNYTVKNYL